MSSTKSDDEADTSYNAEEATVILPPDAFLREQLSPGRAITSLTDEQKAAGSTKQITYIYLYSSFMYMFSFIFLLSFFFLFFFFFYCFSDCFGCCCSSDG